MKRMKKAVSAVLSVLVTLLLFFGVQRLVEPKYDGSGDMPLEGNFTAEYYQETTDHDVIIVGDCEVYENIDPMYLWKNYGITSYIRGNAQQLVWQSYYMLEDTLKYEKPKVLIYNVQSLEYGEPQKETYNRMTLDGMKWSGTKWNAIKASMCPEEHMLDYLFPILRYHSRITTLSSNDLKYYRKTKKVSHNGYYMRIDVLPASQSDVADTGWLLGDSTPEGNGSGENSLENGEDGGEDLWSMMEEEDTSDGIESEETSSHGEEEDGSDRESGAETESEEGITFGKRPMGYLDRMRKLCEEHDIQLILMKAPSLAPIWHDSENQQILDYAAKYNLPYINFYDLLEETGIDYETDTYDGGLHMNLSGADKVSGYLGKVLSAEYGIEDHRTDAGLAKVYAGKYQFYEDMIAAQQKELDSYGEIRNY